MSTQETYEHAGLEFSSYDAAALSEAYDFVSASDQNSAQEFAEAVYCGPEENMEIFEDINGRPPKYDWEVIWDILVKMIDKY